MGRPSAALQLSDEARSTPVDRSTVSPSGVGVKTGTGALTHRNVHLKTTCSMYRRYYVSGGGNATQQQGPGHNPCTAA